MCKIWGDLLVDFNRNTTNYSQVCFISVQSPEKTVTETRSFIPWDEPFISTEGAGPASFYRSSEQTNQTLALKRAFWFFHSHFRFSYKLLCTWMGRVSRRMFSQVQSATSPLGVAKSYTLDLWMLKYPVFDFFFTVLC